MSRSEFYRSRSWREFVEILKIERTDENGFIICAHCGKPIVKKYDCIGHHKEELTEENYENPEISLNPDNVVLVQAGLCREKGLHCVRLTAKREKQLC